MEKTKNIKNAVIYARVSTDRQAEEGLSLDTQEKVCRKYAETNGLNVLGVFRDEGRTGTNMNRPALQELISKCQTEKNIEIVLIQETDRLARNTADHLSIKAILKRAGVTLISTSQPMLNDSPEGQMMDTILAGINQFYSDLYSRKIKRGLQEKFENGWLPGWAPLGYINVPGGDGKNTIVPDPNGYELIQKGFKMYLTGNYSALEISDILYQEGLKSKEGKKICNSIMINTLRNPFYAGVIKWNGQEKQGKHLPTITLDEHKRVLTIMDAHNMHACRHRKYSFLLRGFIICAMCGRKYTAEKHRNGKNVDYYHCSAVSPMNHSNDGQNIQASKLEAMIEDEFKKIQLSQKFIDLIMQKVSEYYESKKDDKESKKRSLLNKKLALENNLTVSEDKLISGVLLDEDFIRIKDRIKAEINIVQGQLTNLETKHEIDINSIRNILRLCEDIHEAYKKAPYEIKRLYLSFFWDAFLVKDKQIIQAKPSELFNVLLEERQVIITGNLSRGQESNLHKTVLQTAA